MGSKRKALKVLFIASEMAPIVKAGGLGDVVGSLPKALFRLGIDVRVLIPRYKKLKLKIKRSAMGSIDCSFANSTHRVRLYETFLARKLKLPVYFLENSQYLSSGSIYLKKNKNVERFLFFSVAATAFLERWGFKPDIIHLHDWHVSLIPILIKNSPNHFWEIVGLPKPKTIFTIHNLGQNQNLKKTFLKKLDFLPQKFLEQTGKRVNFLKNAIASSDLVTTVSPTYKEEIKKDKKIPEIAKVLNQKDNAFFGILNGIDTNYWNIRNNRYLPYNLRISTASGIAKFKNKAKEKLFEITKLKNDKPIFGFVGRLYHQKGLKILLPTISSLLKAGLDFNFIILGEGQKDIAQKAQRLAKQFPKNIYVETRYNEPFAHLLYAASDFIVVPSLYEPCGLIQIIAAVYTAIPVVRKTGGLADTIKDKTSGIVFEKFTCQDLENAIKRALALYKDKKTKLKIIKHNLLRDFSWDKGAQEYLKLYSQVLSVKKENLDKT